MVSLPWPDMDVDVSRRDQLILVGTDGAIQRYLTRFDTPQRGDG